MNTIVKALIKDAATAGLATCGYCTRDFRRVRGIHIGSQRLGMIPDSPCDRVFAAHGGNMTDNNALPWMAHVDGDVLRKKSGDARRFSSAEAAYAAARKASPKAVASVTGTEGSWWRRVPMWGITAHAAAVNPHGGAHE